MHKVSEKDFLKALSSILGSDEEKKKFIEIMRGKKCPLKKSSKN